MFKNEGTLDRLFRVALGSGLLALVVLGPRTLWGLLGLVPLLTGVIGFCPAYRLFGFSSHSEKPPGQLGPSAQ
ncbi:MAG: DUF2892 domain-containing protein [Polyangiaceae bacterium]